MNHILAAFCACKLGPPNGEATHPMQTLVATLVEVHSAGLRLAGTPSLFDNTRPNQADMPA